MQADALSKRPDYEANKLISKQLLTEKNEALKLIKYSEDLKRIIKKHHEFKNHEHSEVQRIYEKIMRKVKVIKKEVADVL